MDKLVFFCTVLAVGLFRVSSSFVFTCDTLKNCDGCKEIETICEIAYICESEEMSGKPPSQQNCTDYIQDCEDRVTLCIEQVTGGMEIVTTPPTKAFPPMFKPPNFLKPPGGGKPNKPNNNNTGNKPMKQCGKNGDACAGLGDNASCCQGYSCETASDLQKPGPMYQCVLLVNSPSDTTPAF